MEANARLRRKCRYQRHRYFVAIVLSVFVAVSPTGEAHAQVGALTDPDATVSASGTAPSSTAASGQPAASPWSRFINAWDAIHKQLDMSGIQLGIRYDGEMFINAVWRTAPRNQLSRQFEPSVDCRRPTSHRMARCDVIPLRTWNSRWAPQYFCRRCPGGQQHRGAGEVETRGRMASTKSIRQSVLHVDWTLRSQQRILLVTIGQFVSQ